MRVISLFAGAGGMDLGFIKAGHKVVWANDVDPDAVRTYNENIGLHAISGDITLIPSSAIPAADLVIGGFPCQGFSIANTGRRADDQRNLLYLQLLRVIRDKCPFYFVAENVKGLKTLAKGEVFKRILSDFEEAGYVVHHRVLNAADFGVPQKRERLFFVGVRRDLGVEYSFPQPTHAPRDKSALLGLMPWVAIGDALKDIEDPVDGSSLPNHTFSKYKLRFNGYLGHRFIDPAEPAPTVTARGDNRGGVVVLHHPNNARRMSVRELASTQSFPLDFVFHCNQSTAYRLIGNAVPPLLAHAVASTIPIELKSVRRADAA